MMEVQQRHSPVGVGPLDFSRRGIAETSAFRVVKPKQTQFGHQPAIPPEANNNEKLQDNPQIPVKNEGTFRFSFWSEIKMSLREWNSVWKLKELILKVKMSNYI